MVFVGYLSLMMIWIYMLKVQERDCFGNLLADLMLKED